MASKFGNRVRNTLNIPFRTLGTAANTVSDSANTVAGVAEDLAKVTNSTADKIRELFNENKKWYQKVLNVPVAAGVGLVSVVEAAVKPVVNGVVNTGKTVRNTVSNTRKSTLGSLFSTKPVSDFSYNTRKTKDGIKLVDVHKRTMDPNKLWTSNRGTWKNVNSKSAEKAKTAAVATAATAAAAGTDKIKELKESFDKKLEEMKKGFTDKINELFAKNKELENKNTTLENENKGLKQANDGLAKQLEAQTKQNQELQKAMDSLKDAKPADKPVEVKTDDKGSKKEENPSAENVEKKTEPKKEDKPTAVKEENKTEAKKEDGGDKGKVVDVHRIAEMIGTEPTRRVCNYIESSHPHMTISFKNDTTEGHSHLGDPKGEYMTIGTENPKIVKIIFAHEFYHVLHHDKINGTRELLNYVANLSKDSGAQFSTIAYEYSEDERPIENCAEIFSKFLLGDSVFDKYMEFLQSGKNNKLIKISQTDAEKIKELCGKIISNLDTTSENTEHKTIKMFPDNEADVTYSAAA